jgi:hypothetical protein
MHLLPGATDPQLYVSSLPVLERVSAFYSFRINTCEKVR